MSRKTESDRIALDVGSVKTECSCLLNKSE